jgi:hypothetical protein
MRKLRLLLAISVLPLAFAATAAATTVVHGVRQVDQTLIAVPLFSNACGFPINFHQVGTITFNDFLDDNGLIVKEIAEENYSATFTNPANGKTLMADRHLVRVTIGQALFSPNQVIFSQSIIGADFVPITIPGLGATAQATGRLVREGGIVVDEAGPHDFVDGTADAFCAYMADP